MPALGAAFAVLVALTLSSEAGYLRSAQDNVASEAAAAARLAWAATTHGVESQPIQAALADYLKMCVLTNGRVMEPRLARARVPGRRSPVWSAR